MKSLKNKLLIVTLLCGAASSATAKDSSMDHTHDLKLQIKKHEANSINFKNIIHPTEVKLSNPKELDKPVVRLSQKEKVEKYNNDKSVREAFKRHAQGLSEGKILNAKQALSFYNMNIDEQMNQLKKWLQDHTAFITHELKEVQKEYHKEVAKFRGTKQQKTLGTVQSIEDGIKSRNEKIKNLQRKVEKQNKKGNA